MYAFLFSLHISDKLTELFCKMWKQEDSPGAQGCLLSACIGKMITAVLWQPPCRKGRGTLDMIFTAMHEKCREYNYPTFISLTKALDTVPCNELEIPAYIWLSGQLCCNDQTDPWWHASQCSGWWWAFCAFPSDKIIVWSNITFFSLSSCSMS